MQKIIGFMERLKTSTKLLLGFGFILLVALLIGIRSLYALREINQTTQRLYEKDLLAIAHIKEASANLIYIGRDLRQLVMASDPAEWERSKARVDGARTRLQGELEHARTRIFRDENKKLLAEFDGLYAAYLQQVDKLIEQTESVRSPRGNRVAQAELSSELVASGDKAERKLKEVALAKERNAGGAVEIASDQYARVQLLSIFLLAGGLAGGGILAWLASVSIRRPLDDLRASIEDIAAGRLDLAVPHTDFTNEIGRMANSVRILQKGARGLETQRWIGQCLTEIDQALQAASSFEEFGSVLIARLAGMLGLVYGALYIAEAQGSTLRRVGGYGCDGSIRSQSFAFGEGLVGQAALDRRQTSFLLPGDAAVGVSMGLGTLIVNALLISPLVNRDRVLAVIELGALEPFDDRKTALVDALLPAVGEKIQILAGNVATRDLLEQTQAQAEELNASQAVLAHTEERTRLILAAVGDGIVGMDNDGRIRFVNPAVPPMLGYAEEELIGQRMHAMVHYAYPDGRDFPLVECAMYQTSQDGQPRKVSNEVLWRKDGKPIPIEYTTTPMRKEGRIVGSVIVFRDISERTRAEEELQQANFLSRIALHSIDEKKKAFSYTN